MVFKPMFFLQRAGLGPMDTLIMGMFDDLFFRSMNTIIWRYSNRSNFEQRDG
jgi:hypothetical protein